MEHGHWRRSVPKLADDEDVSFPRWYFRTRFDLMERFVDDLERPSHSVPHLRRRFLHAVHHAQRVLVARAVVTFLLALGVLATAAAGVVGAVWVPDTLEPGVVATSRFLARMAAVTGSASLLLLGLRLAFDRYIRLVETCATFLGMQIAAASTPRRTA